MNILLLKPPSSQAAYGNMVPLGFAYIAGQLKRDGHKIKIHDFTILAKQFQKARFDESIQEYKTTSDLLDKVYEIIEKEIKSFKPQVVGITCNTSERINMVNIARKIKEINNEIIIVVGGVHVSVTAEQALQEIKELDIIVRGEGERVISELCNKIENNEDWTNVKGITFRNNGKIVSNQREFIEDLDSLPLPARELFDNDKYKYRIPFIDADNNVTGIITSRGCPGRCRFCSGRVFWKGLFRFRSPKEIVDEMEYVLKQYPKYDGFWVFDDNFYAVKNNAIAICKEIKRRKLDIIWGCSGRADMLSEEIAKEMSEAGCKMISIGVESGSNRVLKAMEKQTDLKTIKKAVGIIKKYGMIPRGTFIFGWPDEEWWDVFKTLNVMRYFEPSTINYSTNVLLFPATAITQDYLKDFDWYSEMPEDTPRAAEVPRLVVKGDPLRAKILNKLVKWNFRLYMLTHWGYVLRVLKMKQKRKKYKTLKDGGMYIKE